MAYFEAKRAKKSRGAPPRTPSAVRLRNFCQVLHLSLRPSTAPPLRLCSLRLFVVRAAGGTSTWRGARHRRASQTRARKCVSLDPFPPPHIIGFTPNSRNPPSCQRLFHFDLPSAVSGSQALPTLQSSCLSHPMLACCTSARRPGPRSLIIRPFSLVIIPHTHLTRCGP